MLTYMTSKTTESRRWPVGIVQLTFYVGAVTYSYPDREVSQPTCQNCGTPLVNIDAIQPYLLAAFGLLVGMLAYNLSAPSGIDLLAYLIALLSVFKAGQQMGNTKLDTEGEEDLVRCRKCGEEFNK